MNLLNKLIELLCDWLIPYWILNEKKLSHNPYHFICILSDKQVAELVSKHNINRAHHLIKA